MKKTYIWGVYVNSSEGSDTLHGRKIVKIVDSDKEISDTSLWVMNVVKLDKNNLLAEIEYLKEKKEQLKTKIEYFEEILKEMI
jgi:hypothetical protein